MAPRDIEVALLRLDDQNPRHEHGQTPSEQDLIADLFKGIDGPKMVKLAEHIAAHGMSPADNIMVIPSGADTFTVVEGNRRLASVKLLADPSIAPTKGYVATFNRLKGTMSAPITRLSAVEFKDRDTAKPWILLRHQGEAAGASTVGWDSVQQQRFNRKPGTQTALALDVMDALRAAYPTDIKLIADLDKIEKNKSTTLGRLAKDGGVRLLLGLDTKGDPITSSKLTRKEVIELWKKVTGDLAAGTKTVSDLKKSKEMTHYLEPLLPARLRPATTPAAPAPTPAAPAPSSPAPSTPSNSSASTAGPSTVPVTPTSPVAPTPSSPTKPKLPRLFENVQMNKLGHRVQKVLHETYQLDVEDFPNTAAVMVRVTIELAVDAVFDKKSWGKTVTAKGHIRDKTLAEKINELLRALDPSGKATQYQKLRSTLNQKDGMFSMSSMNAVVHNSHYNPIPSELRTMALNFTPFLAALDAFVS